MTEIEVSYSRMKDRARWYGMKIRETVPEGSTKQDVYYSTMSLAKALIDKEVEG